MSVPAPNPARIIFADDQLPMRILFSAILGGGGYQVQVASTGREAVNCLRQSGADLVLLDLQMPELDGFAALQEIRADEDLKRVPVLATSAYGYPHAREAALEAGFDGFLDKPLDRQTLLDEVARLLGA